MLAAAPRYSEPTFQFSQLKSPSQDSELKLCTLQVFSQVHTITSFFHPQSQERVPRITKLQDSDKLQGAGFGQVAKNVRLIW